MFKQARLLTRPTPARRDAPFRRQGRSSATDTRFTFHASLERAENKVGRLFQYFYEQAVQKDRPARPQAEQEPEAYPLGYVEDSCELRTPLADFFNNLLEVVFRHAIPECIAGDLEEPACFGNVASCTLQRFIQQFLFHLLEREAEGQERCLFDFSV